MKRFKILYAIGCGALLLGCGAEQDIGKADDGDSISGNNEIGDGNNFSDVSHSYDSCTHTSSLTPSTDCGAGSELYYYKMGCEKGVNWANRYFEYYGSCNNWSATNGAEDHIDTVIAYYESKSYTNPLYSCMVEGYVDSLYDRKGELAACCFPDDPDPDPDPEPEPELDCTSGIKLNRYNAGYRNGVFMADSAFDSYGRNCDYWSSIESIIDAVKDDMESKSPEDDWEACAIEGFLDGISDRKNELAALCAS